MWGNILTHIGVHHTSSFNNIDLLHSMLANCCMQWFQGEGTMAAVGQWPPP
jgi:hypothetical protein